MNGLVIVLIGIVVLFAGYLFYGRWLAKKWGLDPKAETPAVKYEDGEDYVPSSKFTVFHISFIHRRCRPCNRTNPCICIRLGAGIALAVDRWIVLRSRTGFRCFVCICEERRKIDGYDHREVYR